MTFRITKTHYHKNPFIGLFLKANDQHVLVPKSAPAKIRELAEETLGVKAIDLFIKQSPLIGLFCVLNQTGCVLAADAENEEKKLLKNAGYRIHTLKSGLAPGNVLLANNHACFASPKIPKKEAASIADVLGVEVIQQPLSGMVTLGAINVVTDQGLFAYNEVTEVEFRQMEKTFHVRGLNGTANSGTPFNALGVVANKAGALVGDLTTGVETQRIFEALSGG
ncbi:translation initiation factor IF-6 [Candidatus Micrarchaeota archaeon]|nr:translation initiation factor IF-6 [Candidatus Micrarchaeota archaeon]